MLVLTYWAARRQFIRLIAQQPAPSKCTLLHQNTVHCNVIEGIASCKSQPHCIHSIDCSLFKVKIKHCCIFWRIILEMNMSQVSPLGSKALCWAATERPLISFVPQPPPLTQFYDPDRFKLGTREVRSVWDGRASRGCNLRCYTRGRQGVSKGRPAPAGHCVLSPKLIVLHPSFCHPWPHSQSHMKRKYALGGVADV